MGMLDTKSVFSRTEAEGEIISDNLYNLTIGGVLAWGFLVNYFMVTNIPGEAVLGLFGGSTLLLFVAYIACCFAGIWLFSSSDNPAVSFLGYNLVVVPIGLLITPFVQSYDPDVVWKAVMVTGLVTVVMMLLGTAYPAFFQKISGALFAALITVIIVELVMVFIFRVRAGIIDWIVALIFCGYIGYDWGRANAIPKTLDNAVDSAASLYLDIINLFIRILAIMGGRRN